MSEDKSKYPFKIGQLVRRKRIPERGLFLVVGFAGTSDRANFWMKTISQKTGERAMQYPKHFELAEENNG